MKTAIIHDWLVVRGGAELVLDEILDLYPEADVFTLVRTLTDEEMPLLKGRKVTTSVIQKLPFGKSRYRSYLPIMPFAVEQFDLSEYDLVISSNYAVAKGVITGPNQLHISYIHSPIRYAWDLYHSYMTDAKIRGLRGLIAKLSLHYIRLWDLRTANSVDHFIANSQFIARRIWKIYRREATVLYPPVSMANFPLQAEKSDYYFTSGRMVPYKKIPLIVESFAATPDRKLIVAGIGPELERAKAKATANVEFVGFVETTRLADLLGRAKAYIYAAEEDFGIAVVEAQACGTPVIAFGRGGALETVIDGKTGLFFPEQTTAAIHDAMDHFEKTGVTLTPAEIRSHAEQFDQKQFSANFKTMANAILAHAAPGRSGL